ncbi:MAG TPA: hypothetical protein VF032_07765, partial [Thermoleophilaceae bacterium]
MRSRAALGVLVVLLGGAGIAAAVLAHGASRRRAPPLSPGTLSYGSFHSAALRGSDHYSIYVPRGYAGSRRRYPVIYFLHGLPEQAGAYKSIEAVVRAMQESGHPAIVVGAQGARSG